MIKVSSSDPADIQERHTDASYNNSGCNISFVCKIKNILGSKPLFITKAFPIC